MQTANSRESTLGMRNAIPPVP